MRDSRDGLALTRSEGVGESEEWCEDEWRSDSRSEVADTASQSSIEGRPKSEELEGV